MNPNNPNFRTADEWFDVCAKLSEELEYYKEMELRYNQLLEETSAKELKELKAVNNYLKVALKNAGECGHGQLAQENEQFRHALNSIGILGMGELAYTSEFTEKVNGIIRGVLK
jgi:hypothetical protein